MLENPHVDFAAQTWEDANTLLGQVDDFKDFYEDVTGLDLLSDRPMDAGDVFVNYVGSQDGNFVVQNAEPGVATHEYVLGRHADYNVPQPEKTEAESLVDGHLNWFLNQRLIL